MLNAVTFHAPDASGARTRSPALDVERRPWTRGPPWIVEVDGGGDEHELAALVAEADDATGLAVTVRSPVTFGQPLVDHHRDGRGR